MISYLQAGRGLNQWTQNIKQTPTQASSRGSRAYSIYSMRACTCEWLSAWLTFKTRVQGGPAKPHWPTWQLSSGYLAWGLLPTWRQRDAGCSGWGQSSLHCQPQMEDTVSSLPHQFFHCQSATLLYRLHRDTAAAATAPPVALMKLQVRLNLSASVSFFRTCAWVQSIWFNMQGVKTLMGHKLLWCLEFWTGA